MSRLHMLLVRLSRLPAVRAPSSMGVSGLAAYIKKTEGVLATGLKSKEVHVDASSLYFALLKARSFNGFLKEQKAAHHQEPSTSTSQATTNIDSTASSGIPALTVGQRKRPADHEDVGQYAKRPRTDATMVCTSALRHMLIPRCNHY